MLTLGHCYSVYIPSALLIPVNPEIAPQAHQLQLLIDQLTTHNGGMTAHQATGVWFDDTGKPHHENITVVSWWFNHWAAENWGDTFHKHVDGIVEAMFACGEKCVAVEYRSPHAPSRMEMRVPEEETPPS